MSGRSFARLQYIHVVYVQLNNCHNNWQYEHGVFTSGMVITVPLNSKIENHLLLW